MNEKDKCGLCGSTSVTDLGHGRSEATVVCHTCGAHWWKRWFSRVEWFAWIDGVTA
jgi:transcription elongation factor Elf1